MAAIESGGDDLVEGRLGEQIAGKLLDDELVERLVPVEGADDPVAIGPDLAVVVEVQAVGVAVPGGVEPEPRQVLAVLGGFQEPVDDPLIGTLGAIVQERVDRREGGG